MCGWMSMTSMSACTRLAGYRNCSRIDTDKHLIELRARRYQLLLQTVGDQGLDAGTISRHAVGQRIAHQGLEFAIAFVFWTVAVAALELLQVRFFCRHEGVHERTRQPRIALDVLVLDYNWAVDRVDAAAAKPIGFDLFDIGDQFRIGVRRGSGRAGLVPTADRRTGAADAGRPGKSGLDLARLHHALQRFAFRRVHHVRRQLERRDVLLIIDHPRDLRGIEPVLVDENAAGPYTGRDRICADSHLFAFEVPWHLDARIGTDHKAAVMKPAHQENRQRNERGAECARNHVGGRCHLADVELESAHHAPECPNDGGYSDEVRLYPCDRNRSALDFFRLTVGGDRNLQ